MAKQVVRYEIREWVGTGYSRPLFRALRERTQAKRIARRLSRRGREVFASPVRVFQPGAA